MMVFVHQFHPNYSIKRDTTQIEGRSRHSVRKTHRLSFVFEYACSSVGFERGAKKCESISSFQPSYLYAFMFGVRDRDDNQWNIYTIMKRLVKFIQNRESGEFRLLFLLLRVLFNWLVFSSDRKGAKWWDLSRSHTRRDFFLTYCWWCPKRMFADTHEIY